MFSKEIQDRAEAVLTACRERGLRLALAESCTGGLITAALTSVPGSSEVVERSFVTYSNLAKNEMLSIPVRRIEKHGAVSEEVARAMAEGALRFSDADIAAAVTGIAGPTGGTDEKPVGLVHMAVSALLVGKTATRHGSQVFKGDRAQIRQQAAMRLLEMIEEEASRP